MGLAVGWNAWCDLWGILRTRKRTIWPLGCWIGWTWLSILSGPAHPSNLSRWISESLSVGDHQTVEAGGPRMREQRIISLHERLLPCPSSPQRILRRSDCLTRRCGAHYMYTHIYIYLLEQSNLNPINGKNLSD